MYQVLIIEDDPMVASIDRKYVEMTPGFQVLDTIPDGSRALDSPLLAKADLIILDYFMPRMNGDEFIDRMHHAGHTPSVIMVTSANDSGIVTSLLSRGVTDYLVKPFEYDRFRDALLRFDRLKKQRKSSQDICLLRCPVNSSPKDSTRRPSTPFAASCPITARIPSHAIRSPGRSRYLGSPCAVMSTTSWISGRS